MNPARLHRRAHPLFQSGGLYNAYNSRNLDAFLETYADDARIIPPGAEPPGQAIKEGPVRGTYARLFRENPKLHCQVLGRTVAGDTITDHERVTGLVGNQVIEGTAIYQVQADHLQSVRLVPD